MGVAPVVALGTIRLSVGRFTTEDDVDRGAEVILREALRDR
jgi:cysteine sulfinate desulfinase/cysteine desulfurase-like protein